MDPHATSRTIVESRLIAVLRHLTMEVLEGVAHALRNGSVSVVEVALNSDRALEQIQMLRKYEFCLGAGTAIDEGTASAAIEAGAEFLFSPLRSSFLLPLCRDRGVLGIPDGFTPTEIYGLYRDGAELIKLFLGSLGAAPNICALLAPCDELKLVPNRARESGNASVFPFGRSGGGRGRHGNRRSPTVKGGNVVEISRRGAFRQQNQKILCSSGARITK